MICEYKKILEDYNEILSENFIRATQKKTEYLEEIIMMFK